MAMSNSVLFVNVGAQAAPATPRRESIFLIPFPHEASTDGTCSEDNADFKNGAILDDEGKGTKEFINKLAEGFLACSRRNQPFKLEVRGFASSKPFGTCTNNRELNKAIANARAQAVVVAFSEAVANARGANPKLEGQVVVRPIPWDTYEAMEAARRWNDKDADEYSHDRAILTRRAEMTLIDAANCEVVHEQASTP